MATETITTETTTMPSIPISSTIPPFPEDVATAPLGTVSLSKLLASDADEHTRLFSASKSLGFFYMDMRGCPPGETLLRDRNSMFDLMEEFYNLPEEERLKYDFASQGSYFGYKAKGREVMDKDGTRDRNMIYNMSKDDILSISPPIPSPTIIFAQRPLLASYVRTSHTILSTVFDSLSTSLGLRPSTFSDMHRLNVSSGCHARFICAPPQPADDRRNALGEHTDFGSLTILFNRLGGLQVQLPGSKDWVFVKPMEGCAIINLGDAMVRFTAGVLRSNLHRVVTPPGAQSEEVRYSLVYFSRPEHDVLLRRLKGGILDEEGVGGEDEGEGVTSKDWLARRHLSKKIGYYKGPEDWVKSRGTEHLRA